MPKVLLELVPIIVFFATYKNSNIIFATVAMVVVTLLCLIISYLMHKKISIPLMISGLLLLISGSITIVSGDAKYIKMKPTIVYCIFSAILYLGGLKKKFFIKDMFSAVIKMLDEHWNILSKRVALYFFFMAITNEIVWRLCEESTWVNFKVFGALPVTLVFCLTQIPFILRNKLK